MVILSGKMIKIGFVLKKLNKINFFSLFIMTAIAPVLLIRVHRHFIALGDNNVRGVVFFCFFNGKCKKGS